MADMRMDDKSTGVGGPPAQPGAANGGSGKRRGFRRYIIVAAVLLVGGFFGWRWWQERLNFESTDNATLDSDLLPVTSEVEGIIVRLDVSENDPVKKGDLLVQIDPRPFKIALAEAEARLHVAKQQAAALKEGITLASTQARAQATQAGGGVAQASADISSAEAQLASARSEEEGSKAELSQAQAELDLAQAEYDRFADLSTRGYVSAQELDVEQRKLTAARTALSTAQEELRQATAKVEQQKALVAQARARKVQSGGVVESAEAAKQQAKVSAADFETSLAQVEVATAEVEQARLDLSRCEIRALADGHIGRKNAAPGQHISAGQILLAEVLPTLWVTANFKETQLARMHPGQEVEVSVDALPGVKFSGKLISFSPASGSVFALIPPENATGNFTKVVQRVPVRIEIDAAQLAEHAEQLAPGMSVIAKVKVR